MSIHTHTTSSMNRATALICLGWSLTKVSEVRPGRVEFELTCKDDVDHEATLKQAELLNFSVAALDWVTCQSDLRCIKNSIVKPKGTRVPAEFIRGDVSVK